VPPPDLAGNAPVADVVHPFEIGGLPHGRHDAGPALHDGGDRLFGERRDADEPLFGDHGLDVGLAPVALADVVQIRLDPDEVSALLQILDDVLPALVAVLPLVDSAVFVDDAGAVHDLDDLEVLTLRHREVVGIAGRRDLDRARPEVHRDVFIGDDRNAPIDEREDHFLAHHLPVAHVVGVNRNRRVAQHRFRARRGDDDPARRSVGKRITDLPQGPLLLLVFDFQIRNRRMAAGAPVDDVVALIDQPVVVQADEDLPDGLGETGVHREPLPLPVAGATQALELVGDDAAVFFLPLPDPGNELLPAEVMTGQAFLGQFLLHHILGGDAGMVRSRHPHGVVALHPPVADHDVLKGVVEGMAHVQHARNIGRRNDDGKLRLVTAVDGVEKVVVLPVSIPLLFGRVRLENLAQLPSAHEISPS